MTGSVREFPDYRMRYRRDIDELAICCSECKDEVDEFTAIAKGWRYYSDGTSLLPYCPECARREFAPDARASAASPRARSRDASSSGSSS